jgi:uncharacterized protein (TIGR01777 family)
METVLITGGTGLVGKKLTSALLLKGYKVIILSRSVAPEINHKNLSFARWDVKKKEIDTSSIQAADYIMHLAGAGVVNKKWTTSYKQEIVDSRVESSRIIVEALQKHSNKVKAIVSASAIGWYGADKMPVKPFVETDSADGNFLGNTCRLWEESIEPVTGLGKRLVKYRTGIVLSNDGGALFEFKKTIRFGLAAILGNGNQIISWIHINDLCNLLIAGIENENLSGSYNAVAPNPVSNKTLTLKLARALNGKFYLPVNVPVFVLKLMLGQRSIEVLKSATVSCKKILATGFTFRFSNIDEALEELTKNS